MPQSRFIATPAEVTALLGSFFTRWECWVLAELPSERPAVPKRTSDASARNVLAIRERPGDQGTVRWAPPLLVWPTGEAEPLVRWNPSRDDPTLNLPDWSASSPSVLCRFPEETVLRKRIHRLGWGSVAWRTEYSGVAPSAKLKSLYRELVGRLNRTMSSYVLRRRVRIARESKRMVLEGEAQFPWRGGWYPDMPV